MEPLEHSLVLPDGPGGPSGGVVGAVGDQGEGQEPFAGAGMVGLEAQSSQVVGGLPPLQISTRIIGSPPLAG
jgi:hypothetical protein